jgi:hypothetical protein
LWVPQLLPQWRQTLTCVNLIGSIIYAIIGAYAAIALTLYYFYLQARPATRFVTS